jgi:hypothetical protein
MNCINMNSAKQNLNVLYIGSETFYGNIQGKEDSKHEKLYRFKIVKDETEKLIALPEEYSMEIDEWKVACPGWRLEDVTGSKGLYLDFGQKRFIIPTEKAWDEINDALNNYEHKRP